MPNIFSEKWDAESDTVHLAAVAAAAGAEHLGASVVALDAGGQHAPFHLHHANEELCVVLSGTPRLRTPTGVRALAPGDVVCFPRGAAGAHSLRNDTDEPCRLLLLSEMRYPEIIEHLDTGTVLTLTGPEQAQAFPAGSDAPIDPLEEQAINEDAR